MTVDMIKKILTITESAWRRGYREFVILGKVFTLVTLSETDAYVLCENRDAGIRIENNSAVLG